MSLGFRRSAVRVVPIRLRQAAFADFVEAMRDWLDRISPKRLGRWRLRHSDCPQRAAWSAFAIAAIVAAGAGLTDTPKTLEAVKLALRAITVAAVSGLFVARARDIAAAARLP
jgi:hypothetical protein